VKVCICELAFTWVPSTVA